MLAPCQKNYDKPGQHIIFPILVYVLLKWALGSILKSRDITLLTKVSIVKVTVFPVVMYECEIWSIRKLSTKESRVLKFGAGEDSWESLGQQRDQTVNPKGNQPWILIGRTDVEAEAPIFWPHDVKNWHWERPWCWGKDWRQEEKWKTEDEMVGWHHRLDGHEFEQTWDSVKDKEAWHATVHEVTKSQTWLSD